MNVTCLFEQSGTFKHAFERAGHNAIDIDISDKFDETNMICDIFDQLDGDIKNFDFMVEVFNKSDLIIAFFPCTWFSNFNTLIWSRKWKTLSMICSKLNRILQTILTHVVQNMIELLNVCLTLLIYASDLKSL